MALSFEFPHLHRTYADAPAVSHTPGDNGVDDDLLGQLLDDLKVSISV